MSKESAEAALQPKKFLRFINYDLVVRDLKLYYIKLDFQYRLLSAKVENKDYTRISKNAVIENEFPESSNVSIPKKRLNVIDQRTVILELNTKISSMMIAIFNLKNPKPTTPSTSESTTPPQEPTDTHKSPKFINLTPMEWQKILSILFSQNRIYDGLIALEYASNENQHEIIEHFNPSYLTQLKALVEPRVISCSLIDTLFVLIKHSFIVQRSVLSACISNNEKNTTELRFLENYLGYNNFTSSTNLTNDEIKRAKDKLVTIGQDSFFEKKQTILNFIDLFFINKRFLNQNRKDISQILSLHTKIRSISRIHLITVKLDTKIPVETITEFFHVVVRGDLSQTHSFLKKHPTLVHALDDVKDLSDRVFIKISAFQYAFWTRDLQMCYLLLLHLTKEDALLQHAIFIHERLDITRVHGIQFKFETIINVLNHYISHLSIMNYEQAKQYWCCEYGKAQKDLPAWVIYLWIDIGKIVGWITGDFNHFSRNPKVIDSWFKQGNAILGGSDGENAFAWWRWVQDHPLAAPVFASHPEHLKLGDLKTLHQLSLSSDREMAELLILLTSNKPIPTDQGDYSNLDMPDINKVSNPIYSSDQQQLICYQSVNDKINNNKLPTNDTGHSVTSRIAISEDESIPLIPTKSN